MKIWFGAIALAVCASGWASARDRDKAWKAGLAKIVITPEQPMWMSGYAGRDKPAQGKLTELWAKALVLEDSSGGKAVLVTHDLIGIDRGTSVEICRLLEKKFGFPRARILSNYSHTHSGPVVGKNLNAMYFLEPDQQKLVQDYTADLVKKVVKVVGKAIEDLQPAEVSWSIGTAGFAVNRRNNKELEVPMLREAGALKGPVDHDVPVLAVRSRDGVLRGVVFGYACHATVLPFFDWCGDYPGYAQIELEKAHPQALALFWAGCGGDQNPLPRRKVELAKEYGRQLATSVNDVLKMPMTKVGGSIQAVYQEIELSFADLPTREKVAQDALAKDKYIALRAKLLLLQLDNVGSLEKSYPYPVQTWKLGDGPVCVALGGEVVVDYALRLKMEVGAKTWVMGYSNDVMAYIPSLRVLKEGGYEGGGAMVYYGHPTVWGSRVEELIVAAVKEQVDKITAKR